MFVCITIFEEADLAIYENPSWRGNLVEKSHCRNQYVLRNQFCVFSLRIGAFPLIRPLPSSPFLRSWTILAVEGLPCICWACNFSLIYRVGVAFCGRQSRGGHNIITGLFDALKSHNNASVLLGFIGMCLIHEPWHSILVLVITLSCINDFSAFSFFTTFHNLQHQRY